MRYPTGVSLLLMVTACHAANIAPNPGAEVVDGRLVGFALYSGAGKATVSASTTEKHSGASSACLDVSGWWHPADQADTPEHRRINVGLVLAENDCIRATGALLGPPAGLVALSFWYKGDLAAVTVRGVAWPSLQSADTERVHIAGLTEVIVPGPEWQFFQSYFHIPASTPCFSVQANAGGRESEGCRLGKLYVDDVRIVPQVWPDGEMRAVWWHGPTERADQAKCIDESTVMLDRVKYAGFNTVFLWVESGDLAAIDRPELQSELPGADWDWLSGMLRLAGERGLQLHFWYAPWTYKSYRHMIELRDHPSWVAVGESGDKDPDALCFVRPESRQFQLDLLRRVLEQYPDLAGLHIEEPGHATCHCDYCAFLAKEWLGLNIVADPKGSQASLQNLAAFMNGDFFARLRQMVDRTRPEIWVSTNGLGGPNRDWGIARDWPTWSRRGYIDFYVPMIYTDDITRFATLTHETQATLGPGTMVVGMAASWSGIYPRRYDPATLVAEIGAAREAGAKGFCIFRAGLFEEAHWEALRQTNLER